MRTKVIYAGFSKGICKDYIDNFEKYLMKIKNRVEALRIIYNSEDTVIQYYAYGFKGKTSFREQAVWSISDMEKLQIS